MNLLMTAPLMDSKGKIRYFIGAQVDVSNLVKECSHLDGLMQMVEKEQAGDDGEVERKKDEFQDLTEMFNTAELDTVQRYGGRMHKDYVDDSDRDSIRSTKKRVLLRDNSQEVLEKLTGNSNARGSMIKADPGVPQEVREKINGKLAGVYQHVSLTLLADSTTPSC